VTLLVLAYLGGVLTIASPCILPVLPFVFARADRPFVKTGLPILVGMAVTFAAVATLAAVAGGGDPQRLVEMYIAAINHALAECPGTVALGLHMCRGNFKGHYLGAGSYESVAEQLFTKANVNHFLLEYDTARAGDFAPLRFVPKTKGVVLGLISTKNWGSEIIGDPHDPKRSIYPSSGAVSRIRPLGRNSRTQHRCY
jgi:hypothetical protein